MSDVNLLKNKRVIVYGMGRSGYAAANFVKLKGGKITLCDDQKSDAYEMSQLFDISKDQVWLGNPIPRNELAKHDLLVVSPGIPFDHEILKIARELGVQIYGDIELASQYFSGFIVAVTGTNGKSSTSTAIADLIRESGKTTHLVGNIGVPFLEALPDIQPEDVVVVEVSAAQLETVTSFKPNISIILNIKEDHLDRYNDFETYLDFKTKITRYQNKSDICILNFDDPICRSIENKTNANVVFYSQKPNPYADFYYSSEGVIFTKFSGRYRRLNFVKELGNLSISENALAITAVGIAFNLPLNIIESALRKFNCLEHRIEFIREINGVSYYNDSKATNPSATVFALEKIQGALTLITGGKNDKKVSYDSLSKAIMENVESLVLIGETGLILSKKLKKLGFSNLVHASSLDDAIIHAIKSTPENGIVLMSPAANSKDMFSNHIERGKLFKKLVWNIE